MPARFPDTTVERNTRQKMNGESIRWNADEEIVISGLSGCLPESSNIEEFKQQLFDGVDLVTDDERRWPSGLHGLPTRTGKLKNLEHFDATFFGVHAKQANVMDPQLRMLLEATHEAIVDAGINPADIRGSKTGVFIGASQSESDEYWTSDPEEINGYGLTGCCRAMFANRISYAFDFNGPSYAIDTACSSSLYALSQAVASMKSGDCDAAIVGGVNLLLKPNCSLQFHRLNMLSPDGMCKAFDESGNGYVRAEAIVVIYLQKSSVAKRIYATILGAKTNTDGLKEQGITYPSGYMQNKLIKELYQEVGVDPSEVAYVEAHGTGTKVGDPQEVNSIVDAFCKNRKEPLLIGSVKSNMGHSEPASGLCSIAKVLIGMETGILPRNLHFNKPNPDIPGLSDGRLKVVSRNMPWNGGYVGINSFGFGGANAHILMKSNPKPKINQSVETIPRLFTVSGRTADAVNTFLNKLEEFSNDDELLTLIHEIHQKNINGHNYRGYLLSGENKLKEVSQTSAEKRPIWFVYAGMGSQWSGMGKKLMKLNTFKKAIDKCSYVLKSHGINLEEILSTSDDSTFDSVLNSFIAIAAIQIGLTDVLTSLGIHPDGIVGHSIGEVGCAYADGTFTAEQTILTAFSRGKAILDSKLPLGAMAAVGLSWEECKKRCPPGVYPACHNSADNVSVSGNPEGIKKFVEELSAEDIFARAVKSSGNAFHSKYITDAGPKLRKALDEIIPNPKPRSSKWISSSIPESAWNTPLAQLSSPAYHVNNLLSPVLFHEALKHVPENAVVIEVAPHCLLQAILKRSLGPNATNIGLMKRGQEDNLKFFMSSLGKLYNAGCHPKISNLYQPITFPVGRGTPMIQSMIQWDHSTEWAVASFAGKGSRSSEAIITIDLSKETDSYLAGHEIDGRVLFPATGYLTLVWKTFAKLHNEDYEKLPVIFENVSFHRATILPKNGAVKFLIYFLEGTGEFELCEGDSVTVSGRIYVPEDISKEMIDLPKPTTKQQPEILNLNTEDIYKELRLRGYNYKGVFQGIHESDNYGKSGLLKWDENWISFMDTMLQLSILGQSIRELYLPVRIQKVAVNPKQHLEFLNNLKEKNLPLHVPVHMYRDISIIKAAGIEIRGLKANLAPRRQQTQPAPQLEKFQFIPYENSKQLIEDTDKARSEFLTILSQIINENSFSSKIKISEISNEKSIENLIVPIFKKVVENNLESYLECTVLTENSFDVYKSLTESHDIKIQKDIEQNQNLIVVHDVLAENNLHLLENLVTSLKEGGMILLEENNSNSLTKLKKTDFKLISKFLVGSKSYFLIKKPIAIPENIIIEVSETNFKWVEPLKAALKTSETSNIRIYLVAQNEENGVMGLTNCLIKESSGKNVRAVFIQDKSKKFSLTNPFFVEQLEKDLLMNVWKNGTWGSFRHILLDKFDNTEALQVEHAYINALTRGDLSSFKWIESPLRYYKQNNSNEEFCSVYYAPLNFRDIMLASGKLPPDALPGDLVGQDCILGLEFAGRDSRGRRVMGIVSAKSLATSVLADTGFLWEVPDKWSLEEASTVPVTYGTSYYALVVRGRMRPGESVLIHAGTGGVGLAAIAVALHMGCTVFTTVGTQAKRDFLKKRFPQLTDKYIGNSRDTSFEQLVLQQTNGRGVDLVLNSLAEEKLQASIRCLAKHGRFLEIGKFDLSNNNLLAMGVFLKNTTFHGIFLDALTENDNYEKKEMYKLVSEGIQNGAVQPLPATVFSENQIEQAFRFIATGKHIGKVVLKIRNEEKNKIQKPTTKLVSAIPRTYMDPDKSYVLVGGLGGFGLEFTTWLINRGATRIILNSRSGIKTGYQSLCIRRWKDQNIKIVISKANVITEAGTKQLLEEANKLGPVGGIFNLAGVLVDNFIENLSEDDFKTVSLPKVDAIKHLDAVSRNMCPQLDYFIAFSSISCGRGNEGQSNYGFANSVMERICELRQAAGFPAFAIQWGAIADVGMVANMVGDTKITISGTNPQAINSCMQALDNFMQQPHSVLCSKVMAEKQSNSNENDISLTHAIANILGVTDISLIQPSVSLSDLGMDSIMGAEIKQTLERNYDVVLSAQDIRNLTFSKLEELSSGTSVTGTEPPKSNERLVEFDWDELVPTKPIIQMSSKSSSNQKLPLFMVHPIEGVVSPLTNLAKIIDVPVYGLQCTASAPLNTLNELAKHYVEQIKTIQPKGPYTICGYSFGACVAFEMAVQLENEKESVKLVLLDGSPSYITTHTSKRKDTSGNVNSEQSEALTYFILQFKDVDQIQTISELTTISGLDAKLTKTVEILKDVTKFSPDQIKMAAASFYYKLDAAEKYKPTKFKGEVTLLKAKDNYVQAGDDYGLNAVCKQKVQVQSLDGNHRSILVGPSAQQIAGVISNVMSKA